jgi:conjugal transfer pilus assembly protein TrbC
MKFSLKLCAALTVLMLTSAIAQQRLPDSDALDKAIKAAQSRANDVLQRAAQQAGAAPSAPTRPMPSLDPKTAGGVDPALLAEQYKNLGRTAGDAENYELMVFASLSMPEETLHRIGLQAKRAGAVVVFRGLKYGISKKGAWAASMNALKPITETGADVQIHPELFSRHNVTAVPTVVVNPNSQPGCQDEACASKAQAVVGDVTLDYALEHLEHRKDAVGKIARDRLKRMRNS